MFGKEISHAKKFIKDASQKIGKAGDSFEDSYEEETCRIDYGRRPKFQGITKDGQTINEGMIYSSTCRIIPKRFSILEHGDLKSVKGVILHQTNGEYAFTTLGRYDVDGPLSVVRSKDDDNSFIARKLGQCGKGIGAHFLISPRGVIYQTARIDKICYHVGYIKALCMENKTCGVEDDQLYSIIAKMDIKESEKWKKISAHESKKEWNRRYPTNNDSIGIEVVGRPKDGVHYPAPSPSQNASSTWLVKLLLELFNLDRSRVFSHGGASPHKMPTEGTQVEF